MSMTTPRVTVPVEPEFARYQRSQIAHLRPYVAGEVLSDRVSISAADLEAGSPKSGDMIARNPANHDDQWLVAADYFAANFEPLSAAPAPEGGAVKKACVDFQEAIDDFEAEVADVMAEGSERADLWDREITVNIDALKTVMSAALATREEAPAEAGERTDIARAIRRAVGDAWIGEHQAEVAADAVLALRAQPPAREDAQPFHAFAERVFKAGHADGWSGNQTRRAAAHADAQEGWERYVRNGALGKSLVTVDFHHAPDALRVAVEAYLTAVDDLETPVMSPSLGLHRKEVARQARGKLREALAALQAEQGAK